MLSNAAAPDTRSTINGLASSGNNVAFAIGPLLGTQAFSWSQQNGKPHSKRARGSHLTSASMFVKIGI